MPKYQGFRTTALYERLSKDDELQGESNSILNQKMYLEDYATKNGFTSIKHFTDDGYTGTNFNRPGFQAMLSEIENGSIGTVIVKDMSRFGRNYLQVGFYTEILFPQKDVRFIAINNSIDSARPADNDFTPFLNIMNEFYAKDTSNKIKSVFKARMEKGQRCSGSVPYGYYRLPDDKQKLIVDPEAATVVRRIFDLAASGMNLAAIAEKLTEMQILIPSAYNAKYHPEQNNHRTYPEPYRWRPTVIATILDRREYLGHTVLKKSEQISFKTKKRRTVAPEDRLVFENTHEPIVDEETWDIAHKFREKTRQVKRVPNGTYTNSHILCGFIYCADCGHRMSVQAHKHKDDETVDVSFRCGVYATDRSKCTPHNISGKNIEKLLLYTLQRISKRVIQDEKGFAQYLQKQYENKIAEKPNKNKAELASAKKRYEELDALVRGLYENYVSGILPERQYHSLMRQYDEEQAGLEKMINNLNETVNVQQNSPLRIERFVALIKKYKEPTELTSELVHELVDKIVVHDPVGKKSERTQQVEIYFNFAGSFDLDFTEEELAAETAFIKQQEEQKRQHRIEWYNEYYQRKKEKRLAENDGHKFAKRVCCHCGTEFWPNGNKQIYCSKECSDAVQKARINKKRQAEKGDHTFRQKNCIVCGKPFWPSNGQELMCSDDCKSKHRREKQLAYYHEKVSEKANKKRKAAREAVKAENDGHCYPQQVCEYCGELYWPAKSFQKYCSKKCGNAAYESNRLNRDIAEKEGHKFFKKNCIVCGKEFWPNGANDICCSDECRSIHLRERNAKKFNKNREIRLAENDGYLFPAKICEYCGKEFHPNQIVQKYCSEECYHSGKISSKHNGKKLSEKEGHPYFKTNCIVCGKEFWPQGPNTRVCSDECRRLRSRQQCREFRERQKNNKAIFSAINSNT